VLSLPRNEEEAAVNALKLLETQHREVEDLFEEFESAGEGAKKTKERIFKQVADALAIHAEIEEKLFYPEAKQASSELEDLLRESVEEHLAAKRLIADLLQSRPEDEQFDARMQVLKEQVEHHVEEEEEELFPKVKQAMDGDALEDLGGRMEAMVQELEAQGNPSAEIPDQTDQAAPI
jgi:hemerythrin superfamily protein